MDLKEIQDQVSTFLEWHGAAMGEMEETIKDYADTP